MTESVSFKAYLKRDGKEVEVRRFGIDGGAAVNYMYLRGKIHVVFPSIDNDQFTIFWQDNDNDYIAISSDEELLVALTSTDVQPFKLYIQIKAQQQQSPGGSTHQTHPRVVCDGCERGVEGFRYKCVTCPDFDLCSSCEAAGLHPEHFMLRISTPLNGCHYNPKFFRKVFGRPHKFHKKHGWGRKADMHGWTNMEDIHAEAQSAGGASHCPFTRQEGPVPGMMDMFDFSALSEFINNLRYNTTGVNEAQESVASAQAASSSQAKPRQSTSFQESNQSTSQTAGFPEPNQSTSQAKTVPRSEAVLHEIGNVITTLLDPFGIDVTFDVQPKSKSFQKPATPATSQQNTSANQQQETTASPQQNTDATSSQTGQTAPPKNTSASEFLAPSVNSQPVAIPMPAPEASTVKASVSSSTIERRNSDDWTLINRESPTHSEEVAMDVDESRAAKSKSAYPELPKEAPSAPPQPDSGLSASERQRVQEAIDVIRSMGFNFEPTLLRELLRRENCDIATVLEMFLSNAPKK